MNDKKVKEIREKYINGTRIKLLSDMDDKQPIKAGEMAEVEYVDDMGTIHVEWDNGRTLGIVPEVDNFEIVSVPEKIKVVFVEVGKDPCIKEIYNTLKSEQEMVGGLIECIPTFFDDKDSYDFVMNEEWRINEMTLNRMIYGGMDAIGGNFMVMKVDFNEGEFVSMSQTEAEEIIEKINLTCPKIITNDSKEKEQEEIER